MLRLLVCIALAFAVGCAEAASAPAGDRLRVIVETDAGGDPDDEQSTVRFLLYASEWDVAGIIANREKARDGENRNPERTGLGIVRRLLDAYEACHPSLVRHDPRYPSPRQLRARTVPGYASTQAGVQLIIEAVDSDDPRPVWFMNWGTDSGSAPSCLTRALDQVRKTRAPEAYARFKSRVHLSSSDEFGAHTFEIQPPFPIWVDTFRPPIGGRRWYHRFSALTAQAGGFELARDVLEGHGPLGALYPTNTTHRQKEGDSMTFLYLLPTGMNDPLHPGWGSWAGRYGPQDTNSANPYYWAGEADTWHGTTHRDNTLLRWAVVLQNDFRARLDWCVQPFAKANHKPVPVLNGDRSLAILRAQAKPGATIALSAAGTTDPDGNRLSYEWIVYPEAGADAREATVENPNRPDASLAVPRDAAGGEIHALLIVTDDGSPALTAYRRLIVTVN